MVIKKFGTDFNSDGGALILTPSEVSENGYTKYGDIQQKTHPDGWTVKGVVHKNNYAWVNDFEATHPVYGKVWGNFESQVFADTEEGYNHFYINHKPEAWDYHEI